MCYRHPAPKQLLTDAMLFNVALTSLVAVIVAMLALSVGQD